MNLWQTRPWLALLLLASGPTMLWAQAPGPGIYLAPPTAPPAARPDGVMPPPSAPGQIPAPSPAPSLRGEPLTLAQLENLAQAYNPILRRDMARIEWARRGRFVTGGPPAQNDALWRGLSDRKADPNSASPWS